MEPMELFLIRHAPAEAWSRDRPDAQRALTERGIERFTRAVSGLSALGVRFEGVLTSPWRRAMETAALLEPLCPAEPLPCDALAAPPGRELLGLLQDNPDDRRLALVGHQPWMGELIGWLAVGHPGAGSALDLRKGSVAWLSGTPEPGAMLLEALLRPRLMRRVARDS